PSAIRNGNRRSRRTVEHRVEQHAERAERLATPLRPEAEEDCVAVADANIERRSFAVQMLFSDEIARQQRRARLAVARENGAIESFSRLEHGTGIDEYRGALRHAGH